MSEASGISSQAAHHGSISAADLKKLKKWRLSTFWVMLIGYIGYYLIRANLPAAFPLLSQTYGFNNEDLGLIAFTSEISYAIGKFINGPIGDKFGGKKIFLLGMAGGIVFNLVFSQMQSLSSFVVVWVVVRYFLSMGWGGVVKSIGVWYEPERNGFIMGIISVNFQFGGVLAALFAGWLVSLGIDWQGLFIYPASLVSAIFIWSFFAAKESPQEVLPGTHFGRGKDKKPLLKHDEGNGSTKDLIVSLWKIPLFRQLLVFAFLTTLLRSIFMFWIPKFLVDIGMGNTSAIINSAVFPMLGCIGTLFIGWYTDQHAKDGNRAQMMWIMLVGLSLSLLGISLLTSAVTFNYPMIILLLGVAGFCLLGPYSMSAGALTLDIAGSSGAASCAGFIDGVGYIGGALASWGAGALSDHLGWSQVFLALTLCSILSVLSALRMSFLFKKINVSNEVTNS